MTEIIITDEEGNTTKRALKAANKAFRSLAPVVIGDIRAGKARAVLAVCKACGLPSSARCSRCGHVWRPASSAGPKKCPGCKSPYWRLQVVRKTTSEALKKRPRKAARR